MKGKFAGYFGKILSSDEVRHKIYIVNSDKSVILNGAKVKKRQKRSHDYLKSTCWVLPEAPTAVSDLEELQHLLSPAKQENFRFLRSRMLSQSQVQSADVSAPSGLRREQGSRYSSLLWRFKYYLMNVVDSLLSFFPGVVRRNGRWHRVRTSSSRGVRGSGISAGSRERDPPELTNAIYYCT